MIHPQRAHAPHGIVLATGLSLGLALGLIVPRTALAVDPGLERRVARLEQMLNQRSLSDLVLQIQQLQQEVQELRGQVETQQYLLRQQGLIGPTSGGSDVGMGAGARQEGERARPRYAWGEADGASDWRLNRVPGSRVRPDLGGSLDDPFAVDSPQRETAIDPGGPSAVPRSGSAAGPGMLALPTPETAAGGEREHYRDAFDRLKARDYPAARAAFEQLLSRYPQGQFADNARYWLGEIGYVTQDYAAAEAAFDRLVADYPLSPKVPAAMLKLGYIYYEQDQLADARAILEQVVQRFPNSSEAQLAQGRLERMAREDG